MLPVLVVTKFIEIMTRPEAANSCFRLVQPSSVVCVCKYKVGKSGGMQPQRSLGDCFCDHSLSPNVETIKRSYLELLSYRHGTRDRFVPILH